MNAQSIVDQMKIRPGNSPMSPGRVTRRHAIVGLAVTVGAIATKFNAAGQTEIPAAREESKAPTGTPPTSLHQEVQFDADPGRVYHALLDAEQFAAFTGMPAKIEPRAGGSLNLFGGLIVGVNVELVPDRRIVQAWRPERWEEGVYSLVRFDLKAQDNGTRLVLHHTSFPEGESDHLAAGWPKRYWDPLKKYLARG